MSHDVRVLRRAVRDLEEIRRYVERDRPLVAQSLVESLLTAIGSLARHPSRGARPRDPRLRGLGYRYLIVEPYLMVYQAGRKVVRIYRVLHGNRRYQELL